MKKKNLVWLKLKHIHPLRQFNKSIFKFIASKIFCSAQTIFFSISVLSTAFLNFSNKEFVVSFTLL